MMGNTHRFVGDDKIGKVPQRQYYPPRAEKGEKSADDIKTTAGSNMATYWSGKPHLAQGRVRHRFCNLFIILSMFSGVYFQQYKDKFQKWCRKCR